jgi:hypothetical protein
MPIPCPNCRWPLELDERGPTEDPAILLTGTAYLGAIPIQVVAIRIDPSSGRLPGYKPGIPRDAYADGRFNEVLEVLLDELEYIASELDELLGQCEPSTVALPSGLYRLCALPTCFKK